MNKQIISFKEFDKKTKYTNLSMREKKEVYKRLCASSSSKDKILRTFLKAAKFTASATGTLASFGAGGDTIPDLLFIVMDTSIMAAQILQFAVAPGESGKYLKKLESVKWDGGPESVKLKAQEIVIDILTNSDNAYIVIEHICSQYHKIIDSLAAIVGGMVAALIPDDAGFGRLIVEEVVSQVIKYGNPGGYDSLKAVWDKIPKRGQEIMLNESEMIKMFESTVEFLKKIIPQDDPNATISDTSKKHATTAALALIPFVGLPLAVSRAGIGITNLDQVISKEIDKKIVTKIPAFVKLLQQCMALVFTGSVVLQTCKRNFNINAFVPAGQKGEITKIALQTSGISDVNGNIVITSDGNKVSKEVAAKEVVAKKIQEEAAKKMSQANIKKKEAEKAIQTNPNSAEAKAKAAAAKVATQAASKKAAEMVTEEVRIKQLKSKQAKLKEQAMKDSIKIEKSASDGAATDKVKLAQKLAEAEKKKKENIKQSLEATKKIEAAKVAVKNVVVADKAVDKADSKVNTAIKNNSANTDQKIIDAVKKDKDVDKQIKVAEKVTKEAIHAINKAETGTSKPIINVSMFSRRMRSRSPKRRMRSRSPKRRMRSRSPKRRMRSRSPKRRMRSRSPKRRMRSRSPKRRR